MFEAFKNPALIGVTLDFSLQILPIRTAKMTFSCSLAEIGSSKLQLIKEHLELSLCDFPAVTGKVSSLSVLSSAACLSANLHFND